MRGRDERRRRRIDDSQPESPRVLLQVRRREFCTSATFRLCDFPGPTIRVLPSSLGRKPVVFTVPYDRLLDVEEAIELTLQSVVVHGIAEPFQNASRVVRSRAEVPVAISGILHAQPRRVLRREPTRRRGAPMPAAATELILRHPTRGLRRAPFVQREYLSL